MERVGVNGYPQDMADWGELSTISCRFYYWIAGDQ